MQDLEQERQEALLRRSRRGDRARVALEELGAFLADRKAQALSKLLKARNPNEAYEMAVEYRAILDFEGKAQAAMAAGDDADKKLTGEG
jgi:hypothetical protein